MYLGCPLALNFNHGLAGKDGRMLATELAQLLFEAATTFGDLQVECCNRAGDYDFVQALLHDPDSDTLFVTVDEQD